MGRPTLPTLYELNMRAITATYPEGEDYEKFIEYINREFYKVYNDNILCAHGNLNIHMSVFDDLNINFDTAINYLRRLGYNVKINEFIYYITISW